MPGTVSVPAGSLSASFTIVTTPVQASQSGTVTARGTSATQTRPLTVRPIGVGAVTLTPAATVGGNRVTGSATLECTAAPGPVNVNLSSSNPTVASPIAATLTVPQGLQSVSFDVTTRQVQSETTVTISANANGVARSAALSVTPGEPPIPPTPPTVSLSSPVDGTSYRLGDPIRLVATASDADGSVSRVEFYWGLTRLGQDTTAPYEYTWSAAPVGSHTLTAVAFDNTGASTTSAAVVVTVSQGPAGEQVVTLQDGLDGYGGTRDAYLYEPHPTTSYGAAENLAERSISPRLRSLVRFAIFNSEGGPVPDGATITSATLSLYKYSYYNYDYRLRALLTSWVESEVTWGQARVGVPWAAGGATGIGSDLATTTDAASSAAFEPGWVEFDVTSAVGAIAAGRANHGWLLEGVDGNSNSKEFRSSEYGADPSLRPRLVIRYAAAEPGTPPTVSLSSPADGASYRLGDPIRLAATASDADGSVSRVEFYWGLTRLGQDTTAPYEYTWSAAPVGNHTLTAVAFDNTGASTTSAAVVVTVSQGPAGEQVVTLQDGLDGYGGTRDAYLYEPHPSTSYGAAENLAERSISPRLRSLVRFAIFNSEGGPVPDGATITSATLSLYKYSYYNYDYRLRALLTSWVESEVTWGQARVGVPWAAGGATGIGSDLATTTDAASSAAFEPGWVEFDVTSAVGAIAAGRANHGWLLEGVDGNSNSKEFRSREYARRSLAAAQAGDPIRRR